MRIVVAICLMALTLAAAEKKPRAFPADLGATRVETYKKVGDVELRVHIWEPEGHNAADKRPAVVFFFGGGWKSGSGLKLIADRATV